MIKVLDKFDRLVTTRGILIAFWSVFWLLNGFDKFFNLETFFGVSRDLKFIEYFARLGLPSGPALTTLYVFAIFEIIIGLGFLYELIRKETGPAVNHFNFKASLLMFFAFSIGDILFGDRQELWEHATFMVLVIASFEFYLRHDLLSAATGNESAHL